MQKSVAGLRVLACLFLMAVWRQACTPPVVAGLAGIPVAWASHRPDLVNASWRELACLPGVGPARARAIVAHRAGLGVPLQASLLGLIPGIGVQTAQAIQAALAPQVVPGPG
jgi:DNA uptake protein ComE-like DNA-binding protein